MKFKAVWESTKKAGLWFVLTEDGNLYEAWAWEGQTQAPLTLDEKGWRFAKP